jgi:hypothetical protein
MRLNTRQQLRHHKEKRRTSVDKGIIRRHFSDYETEHKRTIKAS